MGRTSCLAEICPNTLVKYICTIGIYAGKTEWDVPSVTCNQTRLTLPQGPPEPHISCLSSDAACGPFTASNIHPLINNLYCLSSTLSVVITPELNGKMVSCSSYSFTTIPIGNATISVLGKFRTMLTLFQILLQITTAIARWPIFNLHFMPADWTNCTT